MHEDLKFRRYLGDGVYAGFDGYQIVLWLEDMGAYGPGTIALEPAVLSALQEFREALPGYVAAEKEAGG